MILAVGGILAALAYLGSRAIQARPRWEDDRAEAQVEDLKAVVEARLSAEAGGHAERLRLEGRMPEAEQMALEAEGHRQKAALHRRKSQELLGRW